MKPKRTYTGNAPAPRRVSEETEQIALYRWAAYMSGKLPGIESMYHIPNEGKRSIAAGARLKMAGLKAGIPDNHLPVARGGYHSLYIELKVDRNKPTQAQKDCMAKLAALGNAVAVCYGWEEAKECIEQYYALENKKGGKAK